MQKFLLITGGLILLIGLAWPWLSAMPLGRLPGDIIVKRENFTFYFPLTTMIVLSVLVALIVWLLRR